MTTPRSTAKSVLILGALLFVGAGCYGGSTNVAVNADTGTAANVNTSKGTDATVDVDVDDSVNAPVNANVAVSARTIKVTAKSWSFDPAEIRVKAGEKIRLEVASVDVTHGLAIPAFDINKPLEPGKTVIVEFTADKKGEFSFFCSVFCGRGHQGMTGKLIVE